MREDNKETGDIRIEHCGLLYYSLAEFCRGEKNLRQRRTLRSQRRTLGQLLG